MLSATSAQIVSYPFNQECEMLEISYVEMTIPEYNCDLGSFEFQGEAIELQTSVYPIMVDTNNLITNGLRAMAISFTNWDGHIIIDQNNSPLSKSYELGESIQAPFFVSDPNGLIFFRVIFNWSSLSNISKSSFFY